MRTAPDVLRQHEQKHKDSCVAWGLELVLKMHEKIGVNDYPLQGGNDPTNWGFGQKERDYLLKTYGLNSREDHFDLPTFEKVATDESNKGFPVIFSIFDHLEIDFKNQKVRTIFHVWTALSDKGRLQYLTRAFGDNRVLDSLPLPQIYNALRSGIRGYQIHCLLHS